MVATDAPMDIATARQKSASPRNQTSTLSAALQGAQAQPIAMPASAPRLDSDANLSPGYSNADSYLDFGINSRQDDASSLLNAMSWGCVSVGSWIREDIVMSGTSPCRFDCSPSIHSSSYLPKIEATFMKDFRCCGLTLDTLHDLLQHFEECHADPSGTMQRSSTSIQAGLCTNGRNHCLSSDGIDSHSPNSHQIPGMQNGLRPQQAHAHRPTADYFNKSSHSTTQDVDPLENMEMDEHPTLMGLPFQTFCPQPPLNVGLVNSTQDHAFPLQHNPTVSSVNTPVLVGPSQPQEHVGSSASGTPGEPDQNIADHDGPFFANRPMHATVGNLRNGYHTFDGTIDQPAKRLVSKQGGGLTPLQLQHALRQGKLDADINVPKRVRTQAALMANGNVILPVDENRPFKCPVIGCEKAYKNQNGLKYHKQHGHQTQTLKENSDGTFSIVDPETSAPYPGTMGMEKEKPHRCDMCGKRYKNLNGLKYHHGHSSMPCNPALRSIDMSQADSVDSQAMSVNVAGAGLHGNNSVTF